MRKTMLLLAAVAVLALPTAASAKYGRHHHRHHHHHPVSVVVTPDPYGPGWRVFWTGVDAFFITPWRTVFVYTPAPVVAKY